MQPVQRHSLVLALLLAAGCNDDVETTASSEHPSRLRIRIAVADRDAPSLAIYDVADRELAATLSLDAPAEALVASQSGDTALALSDGRAQVVSGGVAIIPHKDHIHIFKSRPALLGAAVARPGAVTTTFAEGKWGLFFAGGEQGTEATAVTLSESAWMRGRHDAVEVERAAPHRGFAVSIGGKTRASRAGDLVSDGLECTEITAAASAGSVAVLACREGIVIAEAGSVRPPIALPVGMRPEALVAQARTPFVLARSAGRVALIDLGLGTAAELPFASEPCEVTLETGTEPRVVALTGAGNLEIVELPRLARRSFPAMPAHACSDRTRPRLVASPGRAWITAPTRGEVEEIDTASGALLRALPVGGVPGAIAILGLEARNADLAAGNDALTD